MKVLLLLLAIYLLGWLLRRTLRGGRGARREAAPPPPPPQPVLACAYCGVHLPRDETLLGAGGGVFCGEAHRAAFEKAHPSP